MIRHGKTSTGRQRWRCQPCKITTLNEIDSTAKHLDEFVAWLLGRRRQADLPGGGRSFRSRCEPLWQLWPFSPIVDEVHEVIFVDGIHLGRNAVVLIAQTPDCVLGWYAARSENSRAWGALMSRIAPPALVVTDGGSGFARACKKVWPTMRVQRCTFHAYCRIRQATTTRPKLAASQGLYALGQQLLHVEGREDAQEWIGAYQGWCTRWKDFLEEKTRRPDGGWEYTHERLVRARNSLNKLIRQGLLFTYLDPTWTHQMPAMTNQIESTNARLRQMLRDHRGMRLTRRIKAVFWWCYTHSAHPQPAATILATMPTDTYLENAWYQACQTTKPPPPSPAGATQSASTNSTTPPPTTTPGTNPSNTKCPITLMSRRVRQRCHKLPFRGPLLRAPLGGDHTGWHERTNDCHPSHVRVDSCPNVQLTPTSAIP